MFEFLILLSRVSDFGIMLIAVLLVCLSLFIFGKRKESLVVMFSFGISALLSYVLKVIFKIPRPERMLVEMDGYRFPSGHATMAGIVAALIWVYSPLLFNKKSLIWGFRALAIIWFCLIAFARVYLQVHFLLDVIVGGLIGLISVWFVRWVLRDRKLS